MTHENQASKETPQPDPAQPTPDPELSLEELKEVSGGLNHRPHFS